MKRNQRLSLFLFAPLCLAGITAGAVALDAERDAALQRARVEQVLILSERTALMVGHLVDVPEVVTLHESPEESRDESQGGR